MKVFISFSTRDASRAEALFAEVEGAGADVFKWGRSEEYGKPSWSQILEWISKSDVFVVLLSGHALASTPVQDEIEEAAYSYSKRRKPGLIVAAILEAGVEPPVVIERFARVGFTDFEQGITRLFGQLGLRRGTRRPGTAPGRGLSAFADLGDIYGRYKAVHPEPLPANVFAKQAERVIANYDAHKAPATDAADRRSDLDMLLSELSGLNPQGPAGGAEAAPFLPRLKRPTRSSLPWMKLSNLLGDVPVEDIGASAMIARRRLPGVGTPAISMIPAPVLSGASVRGGFRLSWTRPLLAERFVLERASSIDAGFHLPATIYDGPEDGHTVDILDSYLHHFRVKAIGTSLMGSDESPWSNVVCWKD